MLCVYVSFFRRDDDHFCRLIFCRAIKKWTMPHGHNMRRWITLRKKVHDSRVMAPGKNRLFIIYTLKHEKTVRLSLFLSRARAHMSHRSIATLIFDKCHVGCRCHRPPVSTLRWRHTIDFGRGSIRNCQLRRLLHSEMSSAINFRSEQWSFHEGFWYKSVPLFLYHMVSQLSLHEFNARSTINSSILKSLFSILSN